MKCFYHDLINGTDQIAKRYNSNSLISLSELYSVNILISYHNYSLLAFYKCKNHTRMDLTFLPYYLLFKVRSIKINSGIIFFIYKYVPYFSKCFNLHSILVYEALQICSCFLENPCRGTHYKGYTKFTLTAVILVQTGCCV